MIEEYKRIVSNKTIGINEYQNFTPSTFVVERKEIGNRLAYLFAGLAAEGGEVAGNYAKYCRDDFGIEELTARTEKELGDVMYFTAKLAHELGLSLEEIMFNNRAKLQDRQKRNVLKGDGDNR